MSQWRQMVEQRLGADDTSEDQREGDHEVNPIASTGGWRKQVEARIQPQSISSSEKIEPDEEKGFLSKAKDFISGETRKTDQTEELPELWGSGLLHGEDEGESALIVPALMTAMDSNEIVEVITSSFPHIGVTYNKDGEGNPIPILVNNKNGAATVINKPGVSKHDLLQTLGITAAFMPASRAATAGAGILKNAARVGAASAATQTGIEGVQKLSGGNFNESDILIAGALGGAFEGIAKGFGAAWPTIRKRIQGGDITDEVRSAFRREGARLGVPEDEITDDVIRQWSARRGNRTGLEEEFNVTLSRAQRSGNQKMLSAEDNLRSGMKGDAPQEIFLSGERRQLQQLNSAADSLQNEIGGRAPRLSHRNEAGSAIREGLKQVERNADGSINEAYERVGDASLSPEGFRELLEATRRSTSSIDFPKSNVPAWEGLQRELNSSLRTLSNLESTPGARLKAVHIKQIEGIRRSIANYADASANSADRRNILRMKSAFDGYVDDAVVRGMFSGDKAALSSLKEARSIFRRYMEDFGERVTIGRLGKVKDDTGSVIRKIILENPTDEQVINSLWSVSGFNRQSSANLARRYRELLGPDSDEWNMVRQAAFDQLVASKRVGEEWVVDGAKTFTNFQKAHSQGLGLLRELFSERELAKMMRFSTLAKRAVPDLVKSRENGSGTAQKLLKNSSASIRAFLPFSDFGISSSGMLFFGRSRAKAQARKAFRPFSRTRTRLLEDLKEIGRSIRDSKATREKSMGESAAQSAAATESIDLIHGAIQ